MSTRILPGVGDSRTGRHTSPGPRKAAVVIYREGSTAIKLAVPASFPASMTRRAVPADLPLSRRERQIMDVLHRFGPSSAGEVCAHLDDAPSDTAMRTMLRILEGKGLVRHVVAGRRHVYTPVVSKAAAQKNAMRHVVQTFFGGTLSDAAATLFDTAERPLTARERREIVAMINKSRRRGD